MVLFIFISDQYLFKWDLSISFVFKWHLSISFVFKWDLSIIFVFRMGEFCFAIWQPVMKRKFKQRWSTI